jgi:ABC-type multidrug transport system ATPase subunit
MYALETHSLGKRYGRRWALRDCTLRIPSGSVAALVGLNGAGKTTLMHLAMGLIAPSAGSVQILGQPSSPDYGPLANKCIRARHLQWKVVYQPPEAFWPLQEVESSLTLLLSAALAALTFWRLKRIS